MQEIRISQILDDLERGLTRTPLTPGYNPEIGSIKEKYNLTDKELNYLFKNPKLKGKKTKLPVRFNLIDDTEESDDSERAVSVDEAIQGLIGEEEETPNTNEEIERVVEDVEWDDDTSIPIDSSEVINNGNDSW